MKRNYSAKADQTAIATDTNDVPMYKKFIRNAIETSSKKVPEKELEKMLEKINEERVQKSSQSRFWYDLAERAELCCKTSRY
jgi:site-specific recombinase XerD